MVKKRLVGVVLVLIIAALMLPVARAESDSGKTISAGFAYTLVVKADGSLWCLGSEDTETRQDQATKITDNVSQISTSPSRAPGGGSVHSMAIKTDGSLWAWGTEGTNFYGEIGNGTTEPQETPVKIWDNVIAISAGDYHSAFITSEEHIWLM